MPNPVNCTALAGLVWGFGSGSATVAKVNAVTAKMGFWSSIKKENGASLTSATQSATNRNVTVNWVAGSGAGISCTGSPRVITLNPNDSVGYLEYAAAHEAGHAHGLRHSGQTDNLSPDSAATLPLMGCGFALTPPEIRADDAAQAFTRFGIRATPNWGFEQGLSYWTNTGSSASAVAYQGSGSALLPAGASISTRVRIAESGNYRVVARYAATSAGGSNGLFFQAWVATVDYTAALSVDGCPQLNNFTEQTGGAVANPVSTNRTPVLNTWNAFSQNLGSFPAEGLRIRIQVTNNSGVPVRIDNMALEEI